MLIRKSIRTAAVISAISGLVLFAGACDTRDTDRPTGGGATPNVTPPADRTDTHTPTTGDQTGLDRNSTGITGEPTGPRDTNRDTTLDLDQPTTRPGSQENLNRGNQSLEQNSNQGLDRNNQGLEQNNQNLDRDNQGLNTDEPNESGAGLDQ